MHDTSSNNSIYTYIHIYGFIMALGSSKIPAFKLQIEGRIYNHVALTCDSARNISKAISSVKC